MSNPNDDRATGADDAKEKSSEGQVSEVSSMSGEPEPISPSDATAGMPEGESGKPQAGEPGPNAKPADNVKSNEVDH